MKATGLVAKYLTEDEVDEIILLTSQLKNRGLSSVEYNRPYVLGYYLALHRMNKLVNNDN